MLLLLIVTSSWFLTSSDFPDKVLSRRPIIHSSPSSFCPTWGSSVLMEGPPLVLLLLARPSSVLLMTGCSSWLLLLLLAWVLWLQPSELSLLSALEARLPGPVDPVEVLPVESAVQQDCAQEHEGADRRAIRAPWLFGLRRPRGESQEQAGQDGARAGRTSSNTVSFGSNNHLSILRLPRSYLCGTE